MYQVSVENHVSFHTVCNHNPMIPMTFYGSVLGTENLGSCTPRTVAFLGYCSFPVLHQRWHVTAQWERAEGRVGSAQWSADHIYRVCLQLFWWALEGRRRPEIEASINNHFNAYFFVTGLVPVLSFKLPYHSILPTLLKKNWYFQRRKKVGSYWEF